MRKIQTLFVRAGRRLRRPRTLPAGKALPLCDEGAGFPAAAADYLRSAKRKRVLLVLSPGCVDNGAALSAALEQNGIFSCEWRLDGGPYSLTDVENLRFYYLGERCDAFAVIGDDAAVNLVKFAAVRVKRPKKTAESMLASGRSGRRSAYVLAVPSVSGFAAASAALLFPGPGGELVRLCGKALLPDAEVLDSPVALCASDGELLDASMLSYAAGIEAYLAAGERDKDAAACASRAVELVQKSLAAAREGNAPARRELLFAGRLAAAAVNRTGLGYAVRTAVETAAVSGVAPSATLSVLLPKLLDVYGDTVRAGLERLADAAVFAPAGDAEGYAPVEAIRNYYSELGFFRVLPAIRRDDIPEITERTVPGVNRVYAAPRLFTPLEYAALFEDLVVI